MTQETVLHVLELTGRPMTVTEIAGITQTHRATVSYCLRRLDKKDKVIIYKKQKNYRYRLKT